MLFGLLLLSIISVSKSQVLLDTTVTVATTVQDIAADATPAGFCTGELFDVTATTIVTSVEAVFTNNATDNTSVFFFIFDAQDPDTAGSDICSTDLNGNGGVLLEAGSNAVTLSFTALFATCTLVPGSYFIAFDSDSNVVNTVFVLAGSNLSATNDGGVAISDAAGACNTGTYTPIPTLSLVGLKVIGPTPEPTTEEPTTQPTTSEPSNEPTNSEPTSSEPTTEAPTSAPTTAPPVKITSSPTMAPSGSSNLFLTISLLQLSTLFLLIVLG